LGQGKRIKTSRRFRAKDGKPAKVLEHGFFELVDQTLDVPLE
jgi:hypothetical protein